MDYILVMPLNSGGTLTFELPKITSQDQRPRGFQNKATYYVKPSCVNAAINYSMWGGGTVWCRSALSECSSSTFYCLFPYSDDVIAHKFIFGHVLQLISSVQLARQSS